MHRRTTVSLTVVIALAALVGCSSTDVDPEAAERWLDESRTTTQQERDVLAELSGSTQEPSDGIEDGPATFTFAEPGLTIKDLVVGCFGVDGEQATASWVTRSGSNWGAGGSAEIPCDGSLVTIPASGPISENVNAVTVEVVREGEARRIYAALIGDGD